MSRRLSLTQALFLTCGLVLPPAVSAQQSTTRGFNIGLHLEGAALAVDGASSSEGGGAGLHVGYGVNRFVTLFLGASASAIELVDPTPLRGSWDVAHVDLGLRAHFPNTRRRFVPYLEAALGARGVSAQAEGGTVESRFSGGMFTLGGGLNVYFTEAWALDVNLRVSTGEFDEIRVGNVSLTGQDIDAESSRLRLGVVWWT